MKDFFKSNKVSQLHLQGFRPSWQEKLKTLILPLIGFFHALTKYLFKKLKSLGRGIISIFVFSRDFVVEAKAFITKKLIWSRGRLGRPIANMIVFGVAFMVFIFGELLSNTSFVNSQEISADYLSNVTDVIPNRNVATTLVPEERKQTEPFVYTVAEGDTLSDIGSRFKISVDALKYVNGLTDSSILTIGDTLTIPPVSGLIHTVARNDTLESIADKYSVASQAIADFNYILDTSSLAVGTELVIPDATVPTPVVPITPVFTPSAPSTPINVQNLGDGFIWPTTTRIITQYFSWYHNGLDIAVPWSWGMPPLFASSSGTVTRAGWDPYGLGFHVRIDHGNGYETVYGHMSRIDVGYGQKVSKGQTVGLMGNTGRSTGPHVHFIIYANGVAQNPLNFIN